ncbi:uncharacterized protein PADG_04211 [Paracoccidioides brasiliensis Pb18]|uniref:Uncharacterized protein n=1 Tax=Paracoccidioides brasiliensis (strain Pb18) TaxID=502780 RepID=C1GAC5_PARBD|nr:uncharacterized protein PADG_04211 [Paracoccidioides brasiliensis Pb18]EEH48127.2 hypothetical protein PADG_04211 [Paracoccidioides brasiliensis Pb18]
MEGHRGIAGCRWLFILNAIITVVWVCAGVFMLPDLPNKPNPRAVWFTKDHAELSMERLVCHGHGEPKRTTWAGVSRTFSSWVVYFIAALYIATVLGTYGYVYFGLFLKSQKNADGSHRWSVSQVNATAIGGSVINVVSVWVWVLLSDFMETRWTLIVAQAVLGTIPCIIMSIWTSHPTKIAVSAAYASYFISCICLGTAPLIFSWLSDITPQDPEARSLIIGVSVAGYYSIMIDVRYLLPQRVAFRATLNSGTSRLEKFDEEYSSSVILRMVSDDLVTTSWSRMPATHWDAEQFAALNIHDVTLVQETNIIPRLIAPWFLLPKQVERYEENPLITFFKSRGTGQKIRRRRSRYEQPKPQPFIKPSAGNASQTIPGEDKTSVCLPRAIARLVRIISYVNATGMEYPSQFPLASNPSPSQV